MVSSIVYVTFIFYQELSKFMQNPCISNTVLPSIHTNVTETLHHCSALQQSQKTTSQSRICIRRVHECNAAVRRGQNLSSPSPRSSTIIRETHHSAVKRGRRSRSSSSKCSVRDSKKRQPPMRRGRRTSSSSSRSSTRMTETHHSAV